MNNANTNQIVFIDSTVQDREIILASLGVGTPWYIINNNENGLQQMAAVLADYADLDAIHIISHGSDGSLQLGESLVTQNILESHAIALSSIGNALTETGDILVYGCNVARGDVGQKFVQQLTLATGADVAASNDLTGGQEQGGNWVLEAVNGNIETTVLNPDYSGVFWAPQINPNFSFNDALTAVFFANAVYVHDDAAKTDSLIAALQSTLTDLHWSPLKTGAGGEDAFDVAGGFKHANAYGFAAKSIATDGSVNFILSFEGSNPPFEAPADWGTTNLSEYGWSNYYASLMPLMTEVVNQALIEKTTNHRDVDIIFTGHSLGGAAASVAFADLFLPSNQDFWVEEHAPLKIGSRIYAQSTLPWTDEQIRSLVDDTTVYTFGAPSFLIEPTKFDGPQWTAFIGMEIGAAIIGGDGPNAVKLSPR